MDDNWLLPGTFFDLEQKTNWMLTESSNFYGSILSPDSSPTSLLHLQVWHEYDNRPYPAKLILLLSATYWEIWIAAMRQHVHKLYLTFTWTLLIGFLNSVLHLKHLDRHLWHDSQTLSLYTLSQKQLISHGTVTFSIPFPVITFVSYVAEKFDDREWRSHVPRYLGPQSNLLLILTDYSMYWS